MYEISKHTRDQARIHGVSVRVSTKSGKKIDVIRDNTVIASVGATGYSDYPTYIKSHGLEYANTRRRLYKTRHEKDRNVVNTSGYWADKLLW